ncbi:hypothetical protein MJD09_16495 [bacterium]|nr:hypothetical protein [bacterium]
MNRLPKSTVIGWGIFAISFLLPVYRDGATLADGVLPGWEVLSATINGGTGTFGVVSALTNILMLSTLALLKTQSRNGVLTLFVAVSAATLLNGWWFVAAEPRSALMIGYYLWWASFGVVATGLLAQVLHPAALQESSSLVSA